MPDKIIIENCSPTLAGLKTGNLFRVRYESEETIRREIRDMDLQLREKGLRVIPMSFSETHVLLYIYRPVLLKRDLNEETTKTVLKKMGYACAVPEEDVAKLAKKIRHDETFPHEIGFFLGYPPEDVIGFMEHKNEGVKCVDLWKVYGDEAKARRLFALYRKCTSVYEALWKQGCSIDQLTVKI